MAYLPADSHNPVTNQVQWINFVTNTTATATITITTSSTTTPGSYSIKGAYLTAISPAGLSHDDQTWVADNWKSSSVPCMQVITYYQY